MANRINEIRKRKKLTLQQVSEKTDISVSSLSAYEKQVGDKGYRNPKIKAYLKLADFFNVPVNYLMGLGWSREKVLSQIVDSYFDNEINDDRFSGETYKYGFDYENLSDLSEDEIKSLNINTKDDADNEVIYVKPVVDGLLSESAKKELDDKFDHLTYKLHAYHTELHKKEYKQIAKTIFSKDLKCLNDYNFLSNIGENYDETYISPQYEIAERLKKDLDDKKIKDRHEYLERDPYSAVKEIINSTDFSDTKNARSSLLELFNYLIDKNEELSERIDEVEGELYDHENPDDFNKYSNGDY